jgi:RNA polymerase sigma-70 factor (ECF subfamily)
VLVTDDRDWIDRIRSGNAKSFEALFRLYVRPLTAFAFRYVQSYDAAIGVVDEVFARLWRGRHSWAFHGSVRANLFASAHRVALETLHRTRNDARWHAGLSGAEDMGVVQREAAAIESVGQLEREATVRAAVSRLPARARTVGFMRWTDRLTRSEIATVLGVNVRTVHSLITPASRAMRRRLGPITDPPDTRSPYSTLRDAADAADRFPSIDPDRIEYALAAESIPAEAAELRRDIKAADGEPAMLDAMEAVWTTPREVVEDLVDEETAWRVLARHVAMPHEAGLPEPATSWRGRFVEASRRGDARAAQQVRAWSSAAVAQVRTVARLTKERAPVWWRATDRVLNEAGRHAEAATAAAWRRVAPYAHRAWYETRVQTTRLWMDARTYPATRRALAMIAVAIALITGGWIFAARHASRHVALQHAVVQPRTAPQAPSANVPHPGGSPPATANKQRRHRRRQQPKPAEPQPQQR